MPEYIDPNRWDIEKFEQPKSKCKHNYSVDYFDGKIYAKQCEWCWELKPKCRVGFKMALVATIIYCVTFYLLIR